MPDLDTIPLIPRDHLFGNPTRAQGNISPDGTWLSWLAPHEGVLNVWIAPREDREDAKPMTLARIAIAMVSFFIVKI